jgi:hypothetical protein
MINECDKSLLAFLYATATYTSLSSELPPPPPDPYGSKFAFSHDVDKIFYKWGMACHTMKAKHIESFVLPSVGKLDQALTDSVAYDMATET